MVKKNIYKKIILKKPFKTENNRTHLILNDLEKALDNFNKNIDLKYQPLSKQRFVVLPFYLHIF